MFILIIKDCHISNFINKSYFGISIFSSKQDLFITYIIFIAKMYGDQKQISLRDVSSIQFSINLKVKSTKSKGMIFFPYVSKSYQLFLFPIKEF